MNSHDGLPRRRGPDLWEPTPARLTIRFCSGSVALNTSPVEEAVRALGVLRGDRQHRPGGARGRWQGGWNNLL